MSDELVFERLLSSGIQKGVPVKTAQLSNSSYLLPLDTR